LQNAMCQFARWEECVVPFRYFAITTECIGFPIGPKEKYHVTRSSKQLISVSDKVAYQYCAARDCTKPCMASDCTRNGEFTCRMPCVILHMLKIVVPSRVGAIMHILQYLAITMARWPCDRVVKPLEVHHWKIAYLYCAARARNKSCMATDCTKNGELGMGSLLAECHVPSCTF
jgi:hypothetical protein